jgi:hypothetical protein
MRKLSLLVMGLLAAGVVAGCRPPKLNNVLPPGVTVDTYQQQAASRIDTLWVIDDSGSMAPRQENLAKNLQSFMDVFVKSGIDYRIAVTTTDIFKDRGNFFGNPKVLNPQTPNVVSAFANNVKVGNTGSPFEAGLEAAQLALDNQIASNMPKQAAVMTCWAGCAGMTDPEQCKADCEKSNGIDFLRATAYLYIVFLSDEDDHSTQDVRFFWRSFETVKGIGNDGTVATAAIVGLQADPASCVNSEDYVGARYVALSELTGGDTGSVCDASFAGTLTKLAQNAVGLKRKFALGSTPDPATIKVTINYPCNLPDNQLSTCSSVDTMECTSDEAPDALFKICTPPQGAVDGWTYEMMNNDIFFQGDSVPGVKGQVQIQYCEQGKTCGM